MTTSLAYFQKMHVLRELIQSSTRFLCDAMALRPLRQPCLKLSKRFSFQDVPTSIRPFGKRGPGAWEVCAAKTHHGRPRRPLPSRLKCMMSETAFGRAGTPNDPFKKAAARHFYGGATSTRTSVTGSKNQCCLHSISSGRSLNRSIRSLICSSVLQVTSSKYPKSR